jgi:Spy/CpxP family protein refolding chaperone
MKKITLSIIIASLLPFSMAMAGTTDVKTDGGGDRAEMRAKHEAKFAEELGLTDAQKAKLAEIKAKGQANREAQKAEFDAVLTPEQKAKMETMKKNHEGFKGRKGGHEGHLKPATDKVVPAVPVEQAK